MKNEQDTKVNDKLILRAFKEITDWGDLTPNHTYILNSRQQLVGYIKTGTKEYVQLRKPSSQFDKNKRKFVELTPIEKYIGSASSGL